MENEKTIVEIVRFVSDVFESISQEWVFSFPLSDINFKHKRHSKRKQQINLGNPDIVDHLPTQVESNICNTFSKYLVDR